MRVHIQFTKPSEVVPFNHQEVLTGAFHKWIGKNNVHDNLSLYSFSRLNGGRIAKHGLNFPLGAKWFISVYDKDLFKKLVAGIIESPQLRWGMKVQDFFVQPEPDFTYQTEFKAASPIFVKNKTKNGIKHYLFTDSEANVLMTKTLQTKMELIGLKDDAMKVAFSTDYSKPKTAKIDYKGIENRANICPVKITGKPETKAFAWNVGIGNSTGIGFGAIS